VEAKWRVDKTTAAGKVLMIWWVLKGEIFPQNTCWENILFWTAEYYSVQAHQLQIYY